MDQYCIPLLVDTQRSDHQDNKISSSSLRELRLGTVIKPVAVMLQLSWGNCAVATHFTKT